MQYYFGPKWTTLVAALSDLIGAWLFPFGTYFFGYTICYALTGFIYGMFLYKEKEDSHSNKQFIIRLIISSVVELLIVGIIAKSVCIYITSKQAILVFLPTRVITALVMLPIQVVTMYFLERGLRRPVNIFLREE